MTYLILFFLMKALRSDSFGLGTNLWETTNLLVLVLGCVHYLPIRHLKLYYVPVRNSQSLFWFFGFVFLFLVSLWRTHDFVSSGVGTVKDTITLLLLLLFLYLFQQHRLRRGLSFSRPLIAGLVHALGLFCLINLVFAILNPMYGSSSFTTLALLGLQGKRILFSMYPETHPTYVGLAGSYLAMMSLDRTLLGTTRFATVTRWVYLAAGLIVVLISDSRGMLFATLLAALIVAALQATDRLSWAKYAVWVLPFSHVFFLVSLRFAAEFSAVQSMSRGDSDLATGNSRQFIYQTATNELSDFDPIHVVGFGEYGTYGAGLTRYYMDKFGYEKEEEILISSVAHNTALQVIFDMGYLGLLVYIILIFTVMNYACRLYQAGYHEYIALLYFFVFNIIAGLSETRYGNYHQVAHQLFVALCFLTLTTYNYHLAKQRRAQRVQSLPQPRAATVA